LGLSTTIKKNSLPGRQTGLQISVLFRFFKIQVWVLAASLRVGLSLLANQHAFHFGLKHAAPSLAENYHGNLF